MSLVTGHSSTEKMYRNHLENFILFLLVADDY